MNISKTYYKIKSKIGREIIKRSNNPRPDSYPFISGDGFRKIADFIYDETGKFNPENILEGQIIFVKSDLLKEFFNEIHPKINNRYKLISHNSDKNITEEYLKYIDEKIIHWFVQNLMFEHKKVSVIPIGLENLHIYNNGIPERFKQMINRKINKKEKILFGFNVLTNKDKRSKALNELRVNKLAEEIQKPLNNKEYLGLLNSYKYVASPPGNGIDCHRTWEAIILGVIPVCLNNKNSELLKNAGAPILITDTFEDFNLKKFEVENKITRFDYWKKIINNK